MVEYFFLYFMKNYPFTLRPLNEVQTYLFYIFILGLYPSFIFIILSRSFIFDLQMCFVMVNIYNC